MGDILEIHTFEEPDDVTRFPSGVNAMVKTSHGVFGRTTFHPGWRWSESVKPIARTDSCRVDHLLYGVTGRLHVQMDDGSEADVGPGAVAHIPPGHDAWVVGDEAFVALDLVADAAIDYARPPRA